MALLSGALVGPYEIVSALGAGGMGEVYRARDPRLERLVALKILSTSGASPRQIERFHREARAISRVEHRHICTLHDIGQHDGLVFLVMELLEGETLATRLEQGRMPLDRALAIGAEIADALDAAHRQSLIHRDLKPSNVMLTRAGVKLLDFGIAKLREPEIDPDAPPPTSTLALTDEGTVIGTLPYMAPEQVEGKEVDSRTDLFTFGVVLYEMITGRRPFNGDTRASLAAAILTFDPPVVSSLETLATPSLDRVVRKCLAKDPDERWQTARDLASELRWLAQQTDANTRAAAPADTSSPRRGHLRTWAAAGIGAVVLLSVLALWGPLRRTFIADASTPGVRWTPVTFRSGTVSSARFAPDGDTIVYSATWGGRPYALYTTRRGSPESRPLDVNGVRVAGLSSNGEIAFIRGGHNSGRVLTSWTGTLARVSLGGGASRDLSGGIGTADWTPGETTLAIARPGRVEWPIGTTIYTSRQRLSHLRVAPRGERLALFEGDSLIVLDRAGGKTTLATGLQSEGGSIAWSPDGTEVWFAGTRDITEPILKAVSLSGRERILVSTPPGFMTIEDVFRDGRMLVARHTIRNGLSCLPPGQTQMRELAWLDSSMPEALSADGHTVVFGENLFGGRAAVGGGPLRSAAYLRRTTGEDAIRLSEGYPEDLSPDGSQVLVSIRQVPPLRWIIVPTGLGEPRTLPPGPFEFIGEANFLPDGKRIVFAAREPNREARIFIQDLGDQPPRAITPEGIGTNGLATPDGRFVLGVSVTSNQVAYYPVDGGDARPLEALAPGEEPLQWSRDGRQLYVRRDQRDQSGWPPAVDRIDVTSGRRQPWKIIFPVDPVGVDAVPRILITPDGTSYCFDYYRVLSELFVVEGIK